MRKLVWVLGATALVALIGAVLIRGSGISARRQPTGLEARIAKAGWRFLVPRDYRDMANPVQPTPEVIRIGLEHWADHCAMCHANDGSGDVPIGRSLHPPAPDMRVAPTQRLTDGELFYAIEQGIPFTGMPAWGTGTEDGARSSWELVHFIRHLPKLSPEQLHEMERLNPVSPAQDAKQKDIDDFLTGKHKVVK